MGDTCTLIADEVTFGEEISKVSNVFGKKKHERFGFMTLFIKTNDTFDISSQNITSSATSVEAVEDALQYINTYVAEVSARTA